MIAAIVLTSTAGEVLTAGAMKSVGDLDEIRAHSGLKGAIRAVLTCPLFFAGVSFLALSFFRFALRAEPPEPEPGCARHRPRSRWLQMPLPLNFSSKKTWTAAAGLRPCWSASECIFWRIEKDRG
jgi:hypothetical protein